MEVGYPMVIGKMKKEFTSPINEIIFCYLDLFNFQGVDKDGYVLRLGYVYRYLIFNFLDLLLVTVVLLKQDDRF